MVRVLIAVYLALVALVPRAGYGRRTYVQGLALISRKLYMYITKHQNALQANLPSPVYTCVTSLLTCLLEIMAYLNKSAP